MATDNVVLPPTGTGTANVRVATRQGTYSGDTDAEVQVVGLATFTGSDDAKTIVDVAQSSAAALPTGDIGAATGVSAQTTVSNSSTTIVSSRTTRRSVIILNLQTVAVYIDASGGTATTSHFRLDPGAALELNYTGAVTGITSAAYTASGDAKVHTIETYY